MPVNIQVSCIRKRNHNNPHERIEGLGGVNPNGSNWYLTENQIIEDILKPEASRQWNFYTAVGGHSVWIILAVHAGRYYLKTESDNYAPDNLLSLDECPR